jgi:hypothetical protein
MLLIATEPRNHQRKREICRFHVDSRATLNIAARGQVSSPIVPTNFLEPEALVRDKPTISIVRS